MIARCTPCSHGDSMSYAMILRSSGSEGDANQFVINEFRAIRYLVAFPGTRRPSELARR